MENLDGFQTFAWVVLNSIARARNAIYLDTNAWSLLAKGEVPAEPLEKWAKANGCFLWVARMQVAELAARREIVEMLASLLERVGVLLLDRDQNEFTGLPWHQVPIPLQQFLRLSTQELKEEFIQQFTVTMEPARQQLERDRATFKTWLDQALATIPPDDRRDWSTFSRRLESWIRYKCMSNGRELNEAALHNPECYVGLRLSYAVLFVRYVLNRQTWQDGDYLDYLHAADMAYARVVVTERNMAECIRQAIRRPELTGPELVVDTSWLREPH